MDRTECKNKLRSVIIKMLSSEDHEIPKSISNELLQYYGCTSAEDSSSKEDLDIFCQKLQKYIKETYQCEDSSVVNPKSKLDSSLCEEYVNSQRKYHEVLVEVSTLLEELNKFKEIQSEYMREECHSLITEVEVLNKKCEFLKFQSLLKLYGQEDSLKGHLKLRDLLRKELLTVKEKYEKAVEDNKRVNEMKEFEKLSQLYKKYKELKNTEAVAKVLAEM